MLRWLQKMFCNNMTACLNYHVYVVCNFQNFCSFDQQYHPATTRKVTSSKDDIHDNVQPCAPTQVSLHFNYIIMITYVYTNVPHIHTQRDFSDDCRKHLQSRFAPEPWWIIVFCQNMVSALTNWIGVHKYSKHLV